LCFTFTPFGYNTYRSTGDYKGLITEQGAREQQSTDDSKKVLSAIE